MQPASAKYGGFLGIKTEFVDPFPSGPPIITRPASLDSVQAMPRYICSCHSIVRKRYEGSFCTLVDIGFKTHFGVSSLIPCRGLGSSSVSYLTRWCGQLPIIVPLSAQI